MKDFPLENVQVAPYRTAWDRMTQEQRDNLYSKDAEPVEHTTEYPGETYDWLVR